MKLLPARFSRRQELRRRVASGAGIRDYYPTASGNPRAILGARDFDGGSRARSLALETWLDT